MHIDNVPLSSIFPPFFPIAEKPAKLIAQTPAPLSSIPTTEYHWENGIPNPILQASAYNHGCGFACNSPSVPTAPFLIGKPAVTIES